MTALDKLIEKRAEKMLMNDLAHLQGMLHHTNNRFNGLSLIQLFARCNIKVDIGTGETALFEQCFWNTDKDGFKALKKYLLPSYISMESEMLIKKYDELKSLVESDKI